MNIDTTAEVARAERRRANALEGRDLLRRLVEAWPGRTDMPVVRAAVRHLADERSDRGATVNPWGEVQTAIRGLLSGWPEVDRCEVYREAFDRLKWSCRSCGVHTKDIRGSLCRSDCWLVFRTQPAELRGAA